MKLEVTFNSRNTYLKSNSSAGNYIDAGKNNHLAKQTALIPDFEASKLGHKVPDSCLVQLKGSPCKNSMVSILPYQFRPENIEQEDRAEPLHARILQDILKCSLWVKLLLLLLFFG